MKPVIVYVSAAPGSGKTTLAKLLSEQLYVPHISSDLVHGGVAFTQPDHNRRQTLQTVFVPTMINLAQRGVSFVVDHVLQKGVSEADIIDKLSPYATILYVHTQASDPIRRYINRVTHSDSPSVVARREELLAIAARHAANLPTTSEPLTLDVPLIVVRTDNGYDPALEEIVSFIRQNSRA